MLYILCDKVVSGVFIFCLQIFYLLDQHYKQLVHVLDYRRITSLLSDWINTGYIADLTFLQTDKTCKNTHSGQEESAQALVADAGWDDIYLLQKS
jgi:hypothetical protein